MPGFDIKNPWILAHTDYKAAAAALDVAENVREVYEEMITRRAYENFEKRGGCTRCRGRGWVLTWDTMDSMTGCYAEYGPCDNEDCTHETRAKSGLMPANNKYDGFNQNSTWTLAMEMTEAEKEFYNEGIVQPAKAAEGKFAKTVRELVEAAKPKAGMRVRVKSKNPVGRHDTKSEAGKGRVKPGTEGVITWARVDQNMMQTYFGITRFGTYQGKCCVALTDAKFPNGKFRDIAWIDAKYLEIIDC